MNLIIINYYIKLFFHFDKIQLILKKSYFFIELFYILIFIFFISISFLKLIY